MSFLWYWTVLSYSILNYTGVDAYVKVRIYSFHCDLRHIDIECRCNRVMYHLKIAWIKQRPSTVPSLYGGLLSGTYFYIKELRLPSSWRSPNTNAHSVSLAHCTGNPPVNPHHKGPVIQGFDVLFVVILNKFFNKQYRWTKTPCRPCDVTVILPKSRVKIYDDRKFVIATLHGTTLLITSRGENRLTYSLGWSLGWLECFFCCCFFFFFFFFFGGGGGGGGGAGGYEHPFADPHILSC